MALIFIRHGETQLNKGEGGERLRGWLPVPLKPEGEKQAQQAAEQLVVQPTSFHASDLYRAQQTAHIVGKHIGMTPTFMPELRDWNTGDLAGQPVEDMLPLIHHLVDHPDIPTPNGESFNAFLARFEPPIRKFVASPGLHLVVGHAREAAVLEGIASPVGGVGRNIDSAIVKEKPRVQPGGILMISPEWKTKVINPGRSK